MLRQATYDWIVSASFSPADSFASLRAAFGFFSGHLASEGELLAWQGIEHSAAEGDRHTLHFLWESELHRRDASRYVQTLLRGHLDLTTPGLGGCRYHVGEGWFDNIAGYLPNRSRIDCIKSYVHLLAADEIVRWAPGLIRGAAETVAVEELPNLASREYGRLKSGFQRWSLKRLPDHHPEWASAA